MLGESFFQFPGQRVRVSDSCVKTEIRIKFVGSSVSGHQCPERPVSVTALSIVARAGLIH